MSESRNELFVLKEDDTQTVNDLPACKQAHRDWADPNWRERQQKQTPTEEFNQLEMDSYL